MIGNSNLVAFYGCDFLKNVLTNILGDYILLSTSVSHSLKSHLLKHGGCLCDDVTHLWPDEAKLTEYWEALSLDRQTHAATWTNGDGNLVSAHWHID